MKKTISLLLTLLMLTMPFILPSFAAEENPCLHENMYRIEASPEGNDERYFSLYDNAKVPYSNVWVESFYYCPDCDSIRLTYFSADETLVDSDWSKVDEYKSVLLSHFSIYPPGSCVHKHLMDIYKEPTCKGISFDFAKLLKVNYPDESDEFVAEIAAQFKETFFSATEKTPMPEGSGFYLEKFLYCPDCACVGTYYAQYDANGDVSLEYLDMLNDPQVYGKYNYLDYIIEPIDHDIVDGVCTRCGYLLQPQVDPKPEESSFFDLILAFFNRIIDWFKSIFSNLF